MATGIPPTIITFKDLLCDQFPFLRKPMRKTYDKYLMMYMWVLERRCCVEGPHVGVSDDQLIYVDPTKIKRANDPGFFFRLNSSCDVLGGNWDRNLPRFEDTFPIDAFEDRFINNKDWNDTKMYDFLEKMFAEGRSWGGYTSFPEAEERLVELDELYESIKESGYRTQAEINNRPDDYPIGVPEWAHTPNRHEIAVDIGRDGEIIFEDGRHRLAIAKILDLDRIPVQIVVRHEKWQSRREYYAQNKSDFDTDHPDLEILDK